jgi:hypothetical protein
LSIRFPLFSAAAGLVAGVLCLSLATAAPPALPKDSYKKATATDIDFLQTKLQAIVAAPAANRGALRTVKGLALIVAVYAEADKNDALKSQVLKVYGAMEKKDPVAALEAAKGLSAPKIDPAVKGPAANMVELADIMSPFRVAKAGGMNIESDLKGAIKEGKITAAEAELIGLRSAVIAEFALVLPNDKAATNNAMKMKWERYCKDMSAASKELTEEAAKGSGADQKKMLTTMKRLDASCINCHSDFRDEP